MNPNQAIAASMGMLLWICVAFNARAAQAEDYALHVFAKIQLTDKFWSEAAAFGDINRDGSNDVVAGPYWYQGPEFKRRHEFYSAKQVFKLKRDGGGEETIAGFNGALGTGEGGFSDNYFVRTFDFNGDGWLDILVAGYSNLTPAGDFPAPTSPIVAASWYENPGKRGLAGKDFWQRHRVADEVDNQSLAFEDIFNEGRPVLLCMSGGKGGHGQGRAGYMRPNWQDPSAKWTFHPISMTADEFQWYTHGLGYGDINGDGRNDVLHSDGWWEQPATLANDPVWAYHPFPFHLGPGEIKQSFWGGWGPMKVAGLYDVSADGIPKLQTIYGGSHMSVEDVNGDGLADVVTSIVAHGYGLVWWEQLRQQDRLGAQFRRHIIINREPAENKYGVAFTEMQAVTLLDMDNDGLKDIVTGKRFWGHGRCCLDPEADAPAVLYWFKQVRHPDKSVEFIPHLIDDNSGAGTQMTVGDIDGDGRPDIVVANKKGAFVFLQKVKKVSREEWVRAQPKTLLPSAN